MQIGDVKNNLAALAHGADIDGYDDIEMLLERSGNTLLAKIDPIETLRTVALASVVHDDVYNYALPSDFKDIVDLIPQDNRNLWDKLVRNSAGRFDREKAIKNRVISIEASEGTKIIRINWRSRPGKLLNALDSLTSNGAWSAVTGASNVVLDQIFKKSGTGSVSFDLATTGGGIKNSTMTQVDLTEEDEIADIFVWVYLPSTSITSLASRFGNDLTANYWTPTVQTTQADGTAFKVGWNLIKFAWAGAVETGTVNPATIDSFQLTVNGATPINKIRVDNIIFSIGRNFDIKYYSKYLVKNSTGTWLSRTTDDADICVLDNDSIQIYHLENFIAAAEQVERQGSAVDMTWAKKELNGDPTSSDVASRIGLYGSYRKRYPSMTRRVSRPYSSGPRLNRGPGRTR